MYFDQHYTILIYTIVISLFTIPLALQAIRIKLIRNFSYLNLVKAVNRGFVFQLIIGVIITMISIFLTGCFIQTMGPETFFQTYLLNQLIAIS